MLGIDSIRSCASKYRTGIVVCFVLFLMLVHGVYCYSFSDSRSVFLFATVTMVLFIAIYVPSSVLLKKQKISIEIVFLISIISLGILYSVVFTPFMVPDEMYHFQSSYKMAASILMLAPTSEALPIRGDDLALITSFFSNNSGSADGVVRLTAGRYLDLTSASLFVQDSAIQYINVGHAFDISSNPPQLKLPSALGIALAQKLQLGSYPLFYFGRFFNLLYFAFLVYFAVRITPICKKTMMVAALLPMTLHLASSYSYDAGTIGLAFLLTSLCLKAIYEKGKITKSLCISIAVVAALLAPGKIVYGLIVLAVLLIPLQRFSSKTTSRLYKAGVLALTVAAVVVLRASSLSDMAGVSQGGEGAAIDVRGSETGTMYGINEIISDPINIFIMFFRTLYINGDFYLQSFIGGSLGWFQPELAAPWYVLFCFAGLLVLSIIRFPQKEDVEIPGKHKFVYSLIAGFGFLGIMASMLVGWTFTNEEIIQGVQGRYLIPLLPLLAVAFQNKTIIATKDLTALLVFGMLVLNSMYLVRLFAVAVNVP